MGTSLVVQSLDMAHALQGVWVPFLVWESRSHRPSGMAKKKKKKHLKMIKTAHGEPWLCPFNGLFFCTLNPTGILNASSLNCQPDHGHTLHDNFRWPSITLRLKSKVLSVLLCGLAPCCLCDSSSTHLVPHSASLASFLSLEHARYIGSQGPSRPSAGNTVPQICISLCSSLHKNDASSERPSLISG